MTGDLHCHTRLSDGSLSIEDLINLAVKKGVTTIAITDHDCMAANVRGKLLGERNGIKVIPGVELSAVDPENGKQVHILAYNCEYPDRIEGLCHANSEARKKASKFMMLKTAQRYPITPELVLKCAQGSVNIYKQHIMRALMDCGCATEIYGSVYSELFNTGVKGNIAVTPKYASVEDVIKAVRDADGIPVLAHPVLYDNIDDIERYISYGLVGIEVWHPTCDKENEEKLIAMAKKNKLLMTGGSDFHGMYNHIPCTLGDYSTPKAQLTELLNYKTKMKRLAKKLSAQQEAEK